MPLDMSHIIATVNARTIFGHPYFGQFLDRYLPNFSDIGRTRTDFSLKPAPLVHTDIGIGERDGGILVDSGFGGGGSEAVPTRLELPCSVSLRGLQRAFTC